MKELLIGDGEGPHPLVLAVIAIFIVTALFSGCGLM